MDRQLVYPTAIPLETDILNAQKNSMIGLSKLAAALLGTSTAVNGLPCTQQSVPNMTVKVAQGEIYSLANVDGTAYGSLAADTTHAILKQGILLDAISLACPAPTTSGFSIVYLIEAAYQDIDVNPVTLPYYNASNPAAAYSGPANSGTPQYTTRKGACTVQVKAGVAATTGTQTTPAVDTGFTALYKVTVAYGATSVVNANIVTVSNAPFLSPALLTGDVVTSANDSGYTDVSGRPASTNWVKGWLNLITRTSTNDSTLADNSVYAASTSWVRIFLTYITRTYAEDPTATLSDIYPASTGWVKGAISALTITSTEDATLLDNSVNAASTSWVRSFLTYITRTYAVDPTATLSDIYPASTGWVKGAIVALTRTYSEDPTSSLNDNYPASTSWVRGAFYNLAASAGYSSYMNTNGYLKLPAWLGSVIFQWGYQLAPATATTTYSFPITFPNACYPVVGSIKIPVVSGIPVHGFDSTSTSQYRIENNDSIAHGCSWIAIGY